MGDWIVYGTYGIIPVILWEALPLVSAIYCFVASVKIKRGTAKNITKPKKKTMIFSGTFLLIAILTSLLLPTGLAYSDDYRVWFDEYYNYISDESENVFQNVSIGDSYYDVSNMLKAQGYTTTEPYEKTLERIELKQFRNSLKKFSFADGYEIWFKPEKRPRGNGFVGIKQENGIITAKGIGNLEKTMYDDKKNFGYTEIEFNHDMFAMAEYFKSLKNGDSEAEIMGRFGVDFGSVYSKRFSVENGTETHYYRIYCYGEVNAEEKEFLDRNESRYIELSFKNGELVSGGLYEKNYDKKGNSSVSVEYIK